MNLDKIWEERKFMVVLKFLLEENIIFDEVLGFDVWNERFWEKDSCDKMWKFWVMWNLILFLKFKSYFIFFIDELNYDMFVFILGRNLRLKYEFLFSLEIKKWYSIEMYFFFLV